MTAKIEAANVATHSGCEVFIGPGANENILIDLLEGQTEGTFFLPADVPLESRNRWLAYFEKPKGEVAVDRGAAEALLTEGSSLLAKGIVSCDSEFSPDSLINVFDENGTIIARGIPRFGSSELNALLGKTSAEVLQAYPEKKKMEVIHRDDLVIL